MTLGDDDLRFTVEEAGALTALAAGKFLGRNDVTVLTQRSEGWAAGLHLAAMGLAHVDDPSTFVRRYSGSFGPVAEYLEHEMLLRQPPEVVKLLLQTSVLDTFTAGLGQAVSGRPDAGEILESLADRCLFVYRLDRANGDTAITASWRICSPAGSNGRTRRCASTPTSAPRPGSSGVATFACRLPFRPGPSLRPGPQVAVHQPWSRSGEWRSR